MNAHFPRATRVQDFWRVNSYGYPNCFSGSEKSEGAWATLLSFFETEQYDKVKQYWQSSSAPRKLNHAAVESWKSNFEELGLLYVESGSNRVTITPAGYQLRDAANNGDEAAFAWIGLNLLLRYPLKGPRASRKNAAHAQSDLLLYRFFYAALLDLGEYLWMSELERILCRVFSTSECGDAVEDIRVLRAEPNLIAKVGLPVENRKGAFYNSLNQVFGHAGLNHLLLEQERPECPYGPTEQKRRHRIKKEWLGMVRTAMSHAGAVNHCETGGSATARLPIAPTFPDEVSYFDYLGATVSPMANAGLSAISSIKLMGERVFFLSAGVEYVPEATGVIRGPVSALCQLASGQRVILSHDERFTYLVLSKELVDANSVRVHLRKAMPITNINIIRSLLAG